MKAKHPPRTASHKPAKIAVAHAFLLNAARVRKKKRRDVDTRTAQKKTIASLLRMTHVDFEVAAEKKLKVG